MRVVIAGANGQLGAALRKEQPAHGEFHWFSREMLDLTAPQKMAATIASLTPTHVINAAAYTNVDRAETDAETAFAVNQEGAAALARAAHACGAHFTHVSTDFVFDGSASRPIPPDAPVNPLNVYGASKAGGEAAIGTAANALIVRTAWVYGARGKNFVGTMLRLAREGRPLRVVADQVGTPTHARSLARALWRLAEQRVGGIHHHTDAGVASWYDLAHAAVDEASRLGLAPLDVAITPIATTDFPTPARRPNYSVLDASSTRALLDTPPRHWRDELRAMLREEARA